MMPCHGRMVVSSTVQVLRNLIKSPNSRKVHFVRIVRSNYTLILVCVSLCVVCDPHIHGLLKLI